MIPVQVVLDRGTLAPLDLTPMVQDDLNWSSVVPGGFASCSFTLAGDPRRLVKQLPFLDIVRVIGDSGRVLFEGQIEDLNIVISDTTVGLKVSAFGLQNVLKEVSVRQFWSKRDMDWTQVVTQQGMVVAAGNLTPNTGAWTVNTGQFDPTDLSKQGVQVVGVQGGSAAVRDYGGGESRLPLV